MNINLPTAFKLWQFPEATPEYMFHPKRKWRIDWAFVKYHVGLEIEGGVWIGGAHVRGKHYEADCEKYSWAAILGWIVVRGTPGMISNGTALELVELALTARGWTKPKERNV